MQLGANIVSKQLNSQDYLVFVTRLLMKMLPLKNMGRIDFYKTVTRTFIVMLLTAYTFAKAAAMPAPRDTTKIPRRFWLSVGFSPEYTSQRKILQPTP